MTESEFVERDTIEQLICNSGHDKTIRSFKYRFVQLYSYDCGPTCCWLIIKWAKRFILNSNYEYTDFLQSLDGNLEDGIWTIDLVKILKDYSFRCVFCTINTDPSPQQYDYMNFYSDNTLDMDINRVRHLFQTLSCETTHIYNGHVSIETIADFLCYNSNVVVIVLVDYSMLYPTRNCCTFKDFCGHYIILIGYNKNRKAFRVADPSRYFHHFIKESVVEKARLTKGTDEDLIFVNLE